MACSRWSNAEETPAGGILARLVRIRYDGFPGAEDLQLDLPRPCPLGLSRDQFCTKRTRALWSRVTAQAWRGRRCGGQLVLIPAAPGHP